jgi:hypothetical protein
MKKILLSYVIVLCVFHASAQVSLSNSPYTENFDNIGSGLPAGFSVQTGSQISSPGTEATFNTIASPWLSTTTGGFYNCASATGLTNTASAEDQASSTNRALTIRQTESFGNPGAAFVFKIANTLNKTNFILSFRMVSLDSTAKAITVWSVDYGFGENPNSFNAITTSPTPVRTGSISTTPTSGYKFFTDAVADFGTALDNKSDTIWIRIWTPTPTISIPFLGNATPTMSGIDDWNLSWTSTDTSAATITTLNCENATNNGTLTAGTAAADVNSTVPYTGGNGGTYEEQSVPSTGVTGLTATLAAGTLENGNGTLTYTISGTPDSSGTASFQLTIGGQTCTITITVDEVPTNVSENLLEQRDFSMMVYPNPVSGTSILRYHLPRSGRVHLQMINIQGQILISRNMGYQNAGLHNVPFNGNDFQINKLGSGTYLLQMRLDNEVRTQKIVIQQ